MLSYNAVYGGISALSVGGASSASSGPLSGDSLARQIQRQIRSYSSDQIVGYEGGPYSLALLGVQTQRDGTLALNSNTLKNTFEKQPKVIDAVFKNQLKTDTAEIAVTQIGTDTKTGSYVITKSGSDYLIDGVAMSSDGSVYSSTSGDSSV